MIMLQRHVRPPMSGRVPGDAVLWRVSRPRQGYLHGKPTSVGRFQSACREALARSDVAIIGSLAC
jgi:hypothetical protein